MCSSDLIPAQEWFGPVAAGPWASCGLFLAASAAGIAATVAVSTATHRWIEEPGIRAGAALIRWLDKRR